MADVQFAQQFAQHFRELVVVADVRQVFLIDGLVAVPIHAVVAGRVEGLLCPSPDVLEHQLALGGDVEHHLPVDADRIPFAAGRIDLGNAAVRHEENALLLLVPVHAAAVGVQRHQHFGFPGAQVGRPQVHASFETRQVVEGLPVLAHQRIAQGRRVNGESGLADVQALPVDRHDVRLGFLLFLFLCGLGLVLLVFHFFQQRGFIFGEFEPVPCLLGEKQGVGVRSVRRRPGPRPSSRRDC